jgi:hypothetical protein
LTQDVFVRVQQSPTRWRTLSDSNEKGVSSVARDGLSGDLVRLAGSGRNRLVRRRLRGFLWGCGIHADA